MRSRSRNSRFIIGAVVLVGLVVAALATYRTYNGYDSLEKLVMQMCWAIEDHDEKKLAKLCHLPIGVPFEKLFRQNEKNSHVKLLSEDRGWKSAYSWTLGGHDSQFGRIHIDFVKPLDNKWYLRCIKQYR